ncbi:MAG TPA: hypothetical protein VIY52_23320 [Streptosporangiaceae bacterium]
MRAEQREIEDAVEAARMPWVIRDVVKDISKAAARRWREVDPLLP